MINIIKLSDILGMVAGKIPAVGNDPRFSMNTNGYRIVVSCEDQPGGVCFHFSFSKDMKAVTSIEAALLLKLFDVHDFPRDLHFTERAMQVGFFVVWINEAGENGTALNVIMP